MIAVTVYALCSAALFLATACVSLAGLELDQRRRNRADFSARFDLPLEES